MPDPNNIKAYNKLVAAAKKAGSPDPHLTASIAMLESGWMKSKFAKQNNPFGQTVYDSQIGKKGIVSARPAADGLLTAQYDSLDSALNHHMDKWGEYYTGQDPKEMLNNLVQGGYNTVNPEWADKIYSIHTGPTATKARDVSIPTQEFSNLLPEMIVTGRDPNKDIQDLESSDIMDNLAYTTSLNDVNYFAKGGAHNMNKMNKRYYAPGGVNPSLPLNVRRNNPGNLRPKSMKNANKWWGEGAVTSISDGGFATFNTPEDGIKALKQQLRVDGIDRGMTIKELIYKFAPPDDDNPTDAYVANMANALGLEVDDKISKDQLDDFAAAIIIQEGGRDALSHYEGVLPESSVRNARLSFGIDTAGDDIAKALGEPTSQDLNDELFGGFESAEAQAAAEAAYYANTDQQGIINAIDAVRQNPEDFQTSIPLEDMTAEDYARVMPGFLPSAIQNPEDFQTSVPLKDMTVEDYNRVMPGFLPAEKRREPYYDEIDYTQIPEEYAIRPAGQNPEDFQTSTPLNQLTAEDYARLGIGSEAIANRLADDYAPDDSEDGFPMRKPSMLEEPAIARDAEIEAERRASYDPMTQEEIDATIRDRNVDEFIREEVAPFEDPAAKAPFVGPPEYVEPNVRPKERRVPNLNNMDYMGLLSSLGTYATRMGPLRRALSEAEEWDQVKYPRYSPALLDATVPKRDVRDAYTTAMSTAGDQGKLDLGALALLATKQAQETSRVEENISNQNAQIRNQAQQLNNQITMQELADTAANKGAAQTMRYQILNDMGKAGEMSLREYNMMRNDANVKKMFEQVFDDKFSEYKTST